MKKIKMDRNFIVEVLKATADAKQVFCSEADLVFTFSRKLIERGIDESFISFEFRYPYFKRTKFVDIKIDDGFEVHWFELKYITNRLNRILVGESILVRTRAKLDKKYLLAVINDLVRIEKVVKYFHEIKSEKKHYGHVIWICCHNGIMNKDQQKYDGLLLYQGNDLKKSLLASGIKLACSRVIAWQSFNTAPVVLINKKDGYRLDEKAKHSFFYNYFFVQPNDYKSIK